MGSLSTRFKGIAAAAGALMSCGALAAITVSTAKASASRPKTVTPASLCTPDETPLFSCAIKLKQVSVCGSGSQAIYRFGQPGKIELSSRDLTIASHGYSGGGETQIAATNKGYTYIVYDKTMRTGFDQDGRNAPVSTSGLFIRSGGKTLASKLCDDDAPIATRARTILPSGAFVPH